MAYGFLITIAIIAVLWFIISSIKKGSFITVPFIISTFALFIVLFINISVMIGAIKMKGLANSSLNTIEQFTGVISSLSANDMDQLSRNGDYLDALRQIGQDSGLVDPIYLQELQNQLGDNWDLLNHYFGKSGETVNALFSAPKKTIERFNSKMNGIIIGNILWSLSFLVITIFIGMYKSTNSNRYSQRKSAYTSRYSRQDDF